MEKKKDISILKNKKENPVLRHYQGVHLDPFFTFKISLLHHENYEYATQPEFPKCNSHI